MVRPLKDSEAARNISVNLRITQQEKEMIETLADAKGMDKTTLIITLVREYMENNKALLDAYEVLKVARQTAKKT